MATSLTLLLILEVGKLGIMEFRLLGRLDYSTLKNIQEYFLVHFFVEYLVWIKNISKLLCEEADIVMGTKKKAKVP